MQLKVDYFIIFLIISIVVAYIFPDLVLLGDGQLLDTITTVGVSMIFFFYGLKLSISEIKSGLKNWKLHLFIQLSTFVIFPLIILAFYPFVRGEMQFHYWLSFFFLAVLPSTVSSSVVLVSIAKGNIPATIFNASISGLIGILVTPLWIAIFISVDGHNSFGNIYSGLLIEIVLPMLLGLILQKYWGIWARRNSSKLANFDKAVILLIVYVSFADSFVNGIFNNTGFSYIMSVTIACFILFYIVYGLLLYLSRRVLSFNQEDTISAVFCGSKKSLTHGSVFGKLLFANNPNIGLYYLPLMIYHALQIMIITVVAQRYNTSKQKK